MPPISGDHLSDDDLAGLDQGEPDGSRVGRHLAACASCRRRHDDLLRLRAILAQSGAREQRPRRDIVPGAIKRMRLRRHAVTNANEIFDGFVAFVRGLTTLFSVGERVESRNARSDLTEDEPHG